jgi:hypothetical protein
MSTDESDPEQSLALLIPLAVSTRMRRTDLLAPGAPSVGMRIPRVIGGEKTLARPMQKVITDERLSPVTVSFTVNDFVLIGRD